MAVLGIIPARGGSQRVPRKNVRPLGGKPLVAWSIEAALGASRLDTLVVSSDDEEILEIARHYGPTLPLKRPSEYATEHSLAIEYVQHALRWLESSGSSRFETIVIVQPSSPFTRAEDIDATVDLLNDRSAETAVSMVELDHVVHPAKLKRMDGTRVVPYLEEEEGRMAAHELPRVFVRNGSVYATRRGVVDRGAIIGEPCLGYVMPRERSVDINEEIDLQFATFLYDRSAL